MRFLPVLAAALIAGAPMTAAAPKADANPLLKTWKTPFGAPTFRDFKAEHFLPAFESAMVEHKAEIARIKTQKAAPTFANTLEALAQSGERLAQVSNVFFNLTGAETPPELQKVAEAVAPKLAAHQDDLSLDEGLFARVKAVHDQRTSLKLEPEQRMLLEKTYRGFVRGGALLQGPAKERMRAINGELSLLGLKFEDNLLKETNAYRLEVTSPADLKGLPEGVIAAAAEEAGKPNTWVFTLKGPSIWPFLQYAENRDLRRQLLQAYAGRCSQGGETDNRATMARIAALRVEKANLLGFKTWADFQLDENMAKNPAGVYGLLNQLWPASLAKAKAEAADLQALLEKDLPGEKLQPWDWRYYSEKVKKARFDLDEEELKPYFSLDRVRDGAFQVASKLFGITFTEVKGVPVYHDEVKAFEVKDVSGRHLGLFYVDYHPRPGKRGGAWMSNYRDQWRTPKGQDIRPVIVNVGNFSRPTAGTPALLTVDEVETLFHELGHGLHGLLSQCRYRPTSGTATPIDFVELPSQIMENWALEPEVLKSYARHHKTGAPMPEALIAKIQKAGTFNQGFATTEFLAAALLDMDWHTLTDTKPVDPDAFEAASLKKMGLIPEILPRYRTPYFAHSAGGYSAGYYSYIWSAVLDTDAFAAFKEKGDLFHPATGKAFREHVLSKGGSDEAMTLYKRFRGAEPKVEPLLKKRGLM